MSAAHVSAARKRAVVAYGATTMLALGFCNALQNGESNSVANALDGIKHTFHVADAALGAAAVVYSLGGSWGAIPIAGFCARHKRVTVLAAMFAVWSVMMFLAASVPLLVVGMTGFLAFTFFRLMIGWMEATDPAAYPLISDYYPHDQRASRIGVFQAVAAVGTALGLGLSGPIVDHFGWRGAFYMWVPIGLFGAWLIGSQPEPERGAQDATADPELVDGLDDQAAPLAVTEHEIEVPDPATASSWEVLKGVLKLRTWLLTAIAMGVAQMMQTGLMFWGLSFMKRTYHMSATRASLVSLALGPPGLAGVILGGFIADRLLRRGVLQARVWVAGVSYFAAGVCCVVAFGTTHEIQALCFLGVASFMIGAAQGPAFAMLYDVTPALLRSEGAALSNILMWPAALGNAIVGTLSTLTGSLRVALALTSPLFIVGGILLLIVGGSSPPAWAGPGYVRAVEEVVADARRRARTVTE
jgi:MFS family permease